MQKKKKANQKFQFMFSCKQYGGNGRHQNIFGINRGVAVVHVTVYRIVYYYYFIFWVREENLRSVQNSHWSCLSSTRSYG